MWHQAHGPARSQLARHPLAHVLVEHMGPLRVTLTPGVGIGAHWPHLEPVAGCMLHSSLHQRGAHAHATLQGQRVLDAHHLPLQGEVETAGHLAAVAGPYNPAIVLNGNTHMLSS